MTGWLRPKAKKGGVLVRRNWDLISGRQGGVEAIGKKNIIDNMHEHKVYQTILEQQHLNIIISLSFGNDSGI